MKFGGLSKFNIATNQKRMGSGRKSKKYKQATALKIMAELGSESNAHGLAKIATSITTKRKVLWSLLVIIGFTAATLQLSFLVQKFLSYQVVEVSNMKEGMPVEFPAVTICNIATISLTKMKNLFDKGGRDSDIMKWFTFIEETNFGEHNSRMDSHQAFYENLPKIAKHIGYSVENFVINCRFNNEDCSPNNFSLFFEGKNYYNCYTFNNGYEDKTGKPNNKKLLMHTTGPQNGLSLILSLDTENAPPGAYGIYDVKNHMAFSAGVRTQVHAPNTIPSPADHGFDVPPGYSTSVGLKAILHSRLPHPHGNCTFTTLEGDRVYRNTLFTCFALCKQKIIVKVCGCKTAALPMYKETDPQKGDIPFCGTIKNWKNKINLFKEKAKVELKTLMCEHKVLTNLNNDRSYEKTCGCFQPCKETAYQKSLSLSYWPLEFYQYSALIEFYKDHANTTDLIKEALQRLTSTTLRYQENATKGIHMEYTQTDLNNINRASTTIRQNLIRLNIYLEDLSIVEFTQMPAYDLADLFADIGGTLGLWMGISVLTIMELVELLVSLILLMFNSETDHSGDNTSAEQEHEKHAMMEQSNSLPQNNPKYNHFQYNRTYDKQGESPI